MRALPEAHLKETIIDKTVYKKGRGEGHEEGASRTLSGPTGGEGCGHGGGMSDVQVWSSGHGAWCFHGQGTSYRGRSGACDGEVRVERCNLVLDGEKWGVWGEMY